MLRQSKRPSAPPTLALEKHQSDEGEGDSEMEKEREEEMVKKEEEEMMKKEEEEEGESERKWLEDAGFEHLVKEYENGKEVQEELGKF